MYINSGYYNNSHQDFKDKSKPLIVGSCGNYRVSLHLILSILVDTFISKISLPMQPVPEIGSISVA